MRSGVAIKYGDIALGAKENFSPSMDSVEPFSDVSILQKNNTSFPNYGNPIEPYSVFLDGSALPFPSETDDRKFGIWSSEISREDGTFSEDLVLYLSATELFTSSGITITFDEEENIFPIVVVVSWYRAKEKIFEETFNPDSAKYFFNKKVEYYDGLEFRFSRLNLPYNRLKIHSIDYGLGVVFYGDELRSVKLTQALDPISTQIEINTCDFEIDSKRDVEYSFQTQQPISIYFNGELKSTCFVNNAKRKSNKMWSVQSEDYMGFMDSIPYYGGMYFDANADEIIADIFSVAKIPYDLSSDFIGVKVSGYIPYTTCREALMQVSFAIGAVVDTAGLDLVKIYRLEDDVSQKIPKTRVMVGQTTSQKNVVTAVEVISHSYKEIEEEYTAYDATQSGYGKNIFVSFSEPLHSLLILNGEILSSGVNYALINAQQGCVLKGKKYQHTTVTKTKRNHLVSATDIENVVTVQGATLVSASNVDNLLLSCYNYIVNSKELKVKIVDGKHTVQGGIVKYGKKKYGEFKYSEMDKGSVIYDKPTKVGDIVTVPVEFFGDMTARIIKQTFSLVGGITVKDSELR